MKAVDQEKLNRLRAGQQPEVALPANIRFEPCVKCKDLIETDALDQFSRCPDCAESSLRLVKS